MKVHGEESQAHHRFLCPFNCSHNHRTILELLRHCEKEHKENLGIYKFHACTRHNDMSLLFQVYNFLNSTLLPSSNSGKSMKRNELTLLISGKIVHIIQLLELKVSVLSKHIYIRVLAQVESAIDNRPPSNIGRACVTTKEAKRKIITASER